MMTVEQAFALARQHHQAGRFAEAETLYRQILGVQAGHAGALQLLGVVNHQTGRSDLAEQWIRRAIALDPRNSVAHCNLGEALRALRRLPEAMASFRRAIELNPNYALAHFKLGNALNEIKQYPEAVAEYRRTLALEPNFTGACNNLGTALAGLERYGEAAAVFQRAIALEPRSVESYTNLGIALAKQGRLDDAIAVYRKALELKPEYPEAWLELGCTLVVQRRYDEAITALRRAVEIRPGYVEVYNHLGHALWQRSRLKEAIAAYRQAIELKPDFAEAHNNLGIALSSDRQIHEAVAAYRRAIQLKPEYPEAHNNLGTGLRDAGQLDEAVAAYRHALALRPSYANAQNNLGVALTAQGRLGEAIAVYRRALLVNPEDPGIHSNLVYALHLDPATDSQEIDDEQRRWNQRFTQPLKRFILPHTNDRLPDRRLRIGYVSSDFRDHVVGRNIVPLFWSHDRKQFEIICYSNVTRPDDLTAELRGRVDQWREILGVTDEAVAERVRADGVDILVDLSQHTSGNRLPVFARQPAPVQVSFAGYPESAGIETIRYRISDRWLEASASEIAVRSSEFVSKREPDLRSSISDLRSAERVYLLDSFWCYDPCGVELSVNRLPALENRHVTFGTLNNFFKVNEPVLKLWARVLMNVPESRLILLSALGSHRQQTLEVFAREGVEPRRIEFVTARPRRDYLELYHLIDVVLDPFPYNGHTTSLDALWMGVPVVSLVGERPVSRAGWSQLSNVGLPELAVFSEEDYIGVAIRLAGDLPHLAELRATLRSRMESSVLMDARHFTRQIETAYRSIWRQWCEEVPA